VRKRMVGYLEVPEERMGRYWLRWRGGEVGVEVPRFLDLDWLRYKVFFCACIRKNEYMAKYSALIDHGYEQYASE